MEPLFQAHSPGLGQPGPQGGTFDDLTPTHDMNGLATGPSRKHAALFKVSYPDSAQSPSLVSEGVSDRGRTI
jgi:hypothetical protein